jgi:hypothetical protein
MGIGSLSNVHTNPYNKIEWDDMDLMVINMFPNLSRESRIPLLRLSSLLPRTFH